jgi:hypothetical protein
LFFGQPNDIVRNTLAVPGGYVKKFFILVALLFIAPSCFAQLTADQKLTDFKALAGLYDKNYGPYEWKKEVFGFDLLALQPWLDQVRASSNDLAFYDVCVRYVASLHDSHDEFILPSYYEAALPLTADIYDGKVLVDFVDNTVLDPGTYPFTVGDELLSVDGVSMATWMNVLAPYTVNGRANPLSVQRLATAITLDRYQGWYTYANKVQPGDFATVVIRDQNTGKATSYSIAWETIFLPLLEEGKVPNPKGMASMNKLPKPQTLTLRSMKERAAMGNNLWHAYMGVPAARAARMSASASVPTKSGSSLRKNLHSFSSLHADHVLAGGIDPFGSFFPLFNPPAGFQLRLGAGATDEFLSGTFPVGSKNIGFIRIPSFEPLDENNAVAQFQAEMIYFEANTDGLVVDLMGNGGGDGCYANLLAQALIPQKFQPIRLQVRATEFWIENFELALIQAEENGASNQTLNTLADALQETQEALGQNRGFTPPIDALSPAACFLVGGAKYQPATDANGNNIAYTKAIVVLTNNFTLSAAEFFGATLQDANRVTVFGTRSDGGGGDVVEFNSTPYSEGFSRVTLSLGVRNHNITTPGYPSAPYIENIGVYPDVTADFQTKANLLSGGAPFVRGFSNLIYRLSGTVH